MNTGFGGGIGQQPAPGVFGQQSVGAFGQGGVTGGFGQPAATGSFGQAATAGGFGQQPATGFGQAGATTPFGQAAGRGATGGFGQPTAGAGLGQTPATTGAFGQPAATGGFGQAATAGGFGQPAATAGGFGQQSATGFGQAGATTPFGQATGRGTTGGFGQPTAGGFGQPAAGTGLGQTATATGAFGQPAATGGFGQQPATAGGFGQQPVTSFGQTATAGGFGQPATGVFGPPAASGFGQPAAGTGLGQTPTATGVFGQPAATGVFGQQPATTGGFGQAAAAGGFGQQPATTAGGFGQQPTTGGFGQAGATTPFGQAAGRGTTGGFGQPAAGGFGQPAAGTGLGQTATATGAFGQPAATGVFGQAAATGGFGQQPAATAGGFGQQPATGGFGQAGATTPFGQATGRGTTGGFGQPTAGTGLGQTPATGAFGQPAATGVFGQPATSGFGQPATAGGFGQSGRGSTGGFGQQPAATAGGFGQQPATGFGQAGRGTTGGFGQPAASGFGQPAAGGFGQSAAGTGLGHTATATGVFGQPAATGVFGQPATSGFGQPATAGGFGQQPATGGFGQPGASALGNGWDTNVSQIDASVLNLPEFAEKPYGNVLLFAPEKPARKAVLAAPARPTSAASLIPAAMPYYQQRVAVGLPTVSVASAVRSNPTPLSVVAFSSAELRDLLNSSKVNLGVSEEREGIEAEKESPALPGSEKTPTREVAVFVPLCSRDDYILEPPLVVLRELTVQQLRDVYGFSVYRRDGKCSIRFLEPVNLVRCDIAEVVDLSPSGEVKLYPGVLTPPPLGYGLRVRARVTVNGVVNTTSSELRLRCQKEGSRFESYDSETGAWVYTINEEGEQEDYDDDGDREVDIVEAEERMQAEEDVSAVSDAPESTISSPARRDPDVRTQRAQPLTSMTPVPLEPHQSISFPQSNIPSSLPLPRHSTRGGEQSLMLPQRTDRVFLLGEDDHLPSSGKSAESVDFQLPYPLPEVKEEPLCERRGVFVVKEHHRKPPGVVYVVRKEDSRIYEMSASIVSRGTMASLGRSFRCGWCIGGRLVAPTFAWLRDGTEARRPVDEVSGSGVTMSTPYFAHATSKHYLQSCAISVLRTMCRYLRRTDVSVNEEGCFPLLSVNLCRGGGVSSLSTERLREVVAAIDAVRFERNTAVGESTARQAKTVLRLFDALYGLPDADEAEKNAITEKRYLTQLRRRNLNSWLRTELEFMDSWSDSDVDINPSQQLLRKLLCGKQREASTVAKAMGSTELSRILGVCGEGNQFGRYVQTSDTHKIDEASGVRQRVISLLSGVVEPFVSQPQYKQSDDGSGNGLVASVPLAATWKQLLGIFAFYGCAPDTPAEETIDNFLSRLRAPTSRRENPFPPYADRISDDILATNRGRSFLARGGEFPDASLSILEGFAAGVAPKASALHPHSSSYCATDYLTPFIIIVVVRALRLQCTEVYCDAETKALLGFAATLECLSDSWFWALLPLHMILDAKCRAVAVEQFLRRHAHRFQGGMSKNNAEFTQLVELMKLRLQLLEVEQLPEEIPIKMPTNAPSIRTHSSLQEALHRFSRDFMRK